MRAFSYAWSLPITWQSWRSHYSISHIRKLHDTRKPQGSYLLSNRSYKRSKFYIAAIGIFDFLLLWPWPWPDDLHIRTWPVLPGNTPDVQMWTSCVKALESYRLTNRQTERQTRLKLYTFAGGQPQLTHKPTYNIMTITLAIGLHAMI